MAGRPPLQALQDAASRERPENSHLRSLMAETKGLPRSTRAWLHLRISVPQGFLSVLGFIFLCLAVFILAGVGYGFVAVGVACLFVDWMRDRDDEGPEEDE